MTTLRTERIDTVEELQAMFDEVDRLHALRDRFVPNHVPALAMAGIKHELASVLEAHDFPIDMKPLLLIFEDDSYLIFSHAFALLEGANHEFCVVYSEHNGYTTFFAETIANLETAGVLRLEDSIFWERINDAP